MRIESTEQTSPFQARVLARLVPILAPPLTAALAYLLIPDWIWDFAATLDPVWGRIAVATIVGLFCLVVSSVLRKQLLRRR